MRNVYIEHERVQLVCDDASRTKKSFQDECNINNILKQYEKTGLLTHTRNHEGNYGDFITGGDYHDHMNLIIQADAMFMELPAKVRAEFENDAGAFLDFVQDPDNTDRMIEMGLADNTAPGGVVEPFNDNKEGSEEPEGDSPSEGAEGSA